MSGNNFSVQFSDASFLWALGISWRAKSWSSTIRSFNVRRGRELPKILLIILESFFLSCVIFFRGWKVLNFEFIEDESVYLKQIFLVLLVKF